jgi:deazaflavin-dependent oxidoreductase (nitroreductase family)
VTRHYLPPPWFLRVIGNRTVILFGNTVLEVAGRRSGQPRSVPINVLDHAGERYLVAPRGETDWVRNLRAAGTGTLKTRRRTETFRTVEVDDAAKPELVEAYKRRWGRVTRGQWEALPDPADHPVFRIERAG